MPEADVVTRPNMSASSRLGAVPDYIPASKALAINDAVPTPEIEPESSQACSLWMVAGVGATGLIDEDEVPALAETAVSHVGDI